MKTKSIYGFILGLIFGVSALATVDGHDRVYLVVQDVNSEEFFVERAPIIGCYGLEYGPRLVQLTSPYIVNSGIGCGGEATKENINYLTCAARVETKEDETSGTLKGLTLDISKCSAKNNSQFLEVLRKVVQLNFAKKHREVKLKLIK